MTFLAGEPKKIEHDYWYSVQFKVMATYTARSKFGNFKYSKRDMETLEFALQNDMVGGVLQNVIDSDSAVFVPPFFATVYFPRQKTDIQPYVCTNTPFTRVSISSGTGLPYGGYARLILLDILRRVRIQKDPKISLGLSLNEYIRELGLEVYGRVSMQLQDILVRMRGTGFYIEQCGADKASSSKNIRFLDKTYFKDPDKLKEKYWERYIELSSEMYDLASSIGFPVDIRIFSRLVKNTLAFDLMLWLPWRFARLNQSHERFVKIPLETLRAQFYPYSSSMERFEFKRKFKQNMRFLFPFTPGLDKALSFDDKGTSLILQNKHVKFLK